MIGIMLAQIPQHEERKAMKMWRAKRVEQPPFREQLAFRRASIGALVLGPLAVHATAIGALAIRALIVKHGRIEHLNIETLEASRLHIRELGIEQEQTRIQGASV